jgi:hypothetical protein
MARLDPAGRQYPSAAYVFGVLGGRLKSVKNAWVIAVLRAHDHAPEWIAEKLSPASQVRLRAIDLHFHDLRHEAELPMARGRLADSPSAGNARAHEPLSNVDVFAR